MFTLRRAYYKSLAQGQINQRIQQQKAAALLGGGQKRIDTQHEKVPICFIPNRENWQPEKDLAYYLIQILLEN